MVSRPSSASTAHQRARSPLTDILVTLAGTADDSGRIESYLCTIAQLTADRVAPVSYASITVRHGSDNTTVAASSEIAIAVDQAQYADRLGPCLDAIDTASPVAMPDITTTMAWPGFRDTAYRLGLRASLSIPLFAARGEVIAALNLYGRESATMAPLTAAVWQAYEPGGEPPAGQVPAQEPSADLPAGASELVAGLLGAHGVRDRIHRAVGVIVAARRETADGAWLTLRLRAAEAGTSLDDVATAVLAEPR